MATLERAIAIAVEAHAGQVDKAGAPYVLHPLRMMLRMRSPDAAIVAALHDVVEDGPGWSMERLRAEAFSERVLEALARVTKLTPDEDYEAFIRRAAGDPISRAVKLADLEDNLNLLRIADPQPRDFERLAKYRRAHEFLSAVEPDPGVLLPNHGEPR
jgi:(p)ppGpp synthase/HD superfamily hydrolase